MENKLSKLEYKELVREHYLKMTGINLWYPKFNFANSKKANKEYIDKSILPVPSICLATKPINKPIATENDNENKQPTATINASKNATENSKWQTKKKLTIFTQTNIATPNLPTKPATHQDNRITKTINNAVTDTSNIKTYSIAPPQQVNFIVWNLNNDILVIGDIYNLPNYTNFFQIKTTLAKMFTDLNINIQPTKQPKQFIWPPSNKGIFKKMFNDFTAIVEAFSSFLVYQLNFNFQKKIIVFGSQVAKVIKATGENINISRGMQKCQKTKKHYFITHNLTNIISNPQIKSSAYNDISPLAEYS